MGRECPKRNTEQGSFEPQSEPKDRDCLCWFWAVSFDVGVLLIGIEPM